MDITHKQHVLISRVDAIGDVVLTLPLCGYLKSVYPDVTISFLGRTYTGPVIKTCGAVDHFINYDEIKILAADQQESFLRSKNINAIIHVYPQKPIALLAKKAGIKVRIGTTNRIFHWLTCNRLVNLSRKNSHLHEAQLNITLLKPLGITALPTIKQLPDFYDFRQPAILPEKFTGLISKNRLNLILHPKSNGSGREWGLERFSELVNILPADRFKIFISGSDRENVLLKNWLITLPEHVIDMTGKLTLDQLISFIAAADGLIAASTGPLHMAAGAGIYALGLYPATRPMHAGRWGPIGKKAQYIESKTDDLHTITANNVFERIMTWIK